MEDALDAIAREFEGMATGPAVFDRELRQRLGRWRLAEPVPAREVLERFARHGGFGGEGATVVVPLHEVDAAELTGEYVVYHPEHVVECVSYYEYARGDLTHLRVEELDGTYPAWRMRFWHPDYVPEAVPSSLRSREALDESAAAPGETVTGLRTVDGEDLFEQLTAFVEREKEAERATARRHFAELSPERFLAEYGGVTDVAPAGRFVGDYGEQRIELRVPAEEPGADSDDDGHPVTEAEPAGDSASGAGPGDGPAAEVTRSGTAPRELDPDDDSDGAQYDSWREVDDLADPDAGEAASGAPADGVGRDDPDDGDANGADAEGDDARTDDPDRDDTAGSFDLRDHGLFPGNEVLVDRVDRADAPGFPVEAEVYEADGRRLELGVYWRRTDDKAAAEAAFGADGDARFVVGQLLNVVPYDRQWEAIEAIRADERKADVLAGRRALSFRDATEVDVRTGDLNEFQARAATSALRAEDVFCVHGPPGTGKTRTLTRLIAEAARDHQRVLAVAHSNQAVDTLLAGTSTPEHTDPRSLHALAAEGELSMARVGSNCEHPVVAEEYVGADHWQADVVGATTSAAAQFPEDGFDLVVVDEATQATIPATLVPYAAGERLVLAGDHRQLPPYHSREHDESEEMETSCFEHLLEVYGEDLKTTLATQYRMHEAIAAFPNEQFYGGRLTHASRNRTWTIGTLDPLVGIDVEGDERRTPRESIYNPAEVEAVLAEVDRLLRHGVDPADVAVITPYTGQVAKVRSALASHERDGLHHAVDVNTVDAFQGGEAEAVIVSFVRSNDAGELGFLGFPEEGPRRLTVALTRAKKRLVLVGDWVTLTTTAPGREPGETATPVYEALYDHLLAHATVESVADVEADAAGRPG